MSFWQVNYPFCFLVLRDQVVDGSLGNDDTFILQTRSYRAYRAASLPQTDESRSNFVTHSTHHRQFFFTFWLGLEAGRACKSRVQECAPADEVDGLEEESFGIYRREGTCYDCGKGRFAVHFNVLL